MKQRLLGRGGVSVSAIGLGCWGMSGSYGPADEAESLATIHLALDLGITLIDTADSYGDDGHNELLVGRASMGSAPGACWPARPESCEIPSPMSMAVPSGFGPPARPA